MTTLPASRFVVRGATLQARHDAAGLIAEAQAAAAALGERAERERAAERERGYADGLATGTADGARIAQNAAEAAREFIAAREAELTELAFAIAARVLGTLPLDDVLVATARHALSEHRSDVRLVLRAAPAATAAMRAALSTDYIEVQADPSAAPGACTLVHPRGATELGVLDQFRAMMAGLDHA